MVTSSSMTESKSLKVAPTGSYLSRLSKVFQNLFFVVRWVLSYAQQVFIYHIIAGTFLLY